MRFICHPAWGFHELGSMCFLQYLFLHFGYILFCFGIFSLCLKLDFCFGSGWKRRDAIGVVALVWRGATRLA